MLREEQLDPDSHVRLKMVRISDGLGLGGANCRPYAGILSEGETGSGAAHSALQLKLNALVINRRVDTIEIVKRLPVLQRTVVTLGGSHVQFHSGAEMFVKHHVASQTQEDAAQGGSGLAIGVSRGGYAGAKRVGRQNVVDAASGRADSGGSEADVQVERALRAREGNADQCQRQQSKRVASESSE